MLASHVRRNQTHDLNDATRNELIDQWRLSFGRPPAKSLSSALLRSAVAYDAQCAEHGGLSKTDIKRLNHLAGRNKQANALPRATAGSHLMREWNGRTYQVAVTPEGYVMDGKTYRSLSAVAKQITGTHWSGPRFFGVSA